MRHKTTLQKEALILVVKSSICMQEVIRKLGLPEYSGGSRTTRLYKTIKDYGIDTSHFKGQGSNYGDNHKGGCPKKTPAEVFVINRRNGLKEHINVLRRALRESGIPNLCKECGQPPIWNNKPLVLQIDHINGNPLDNTKDNLRILCPNCHTQTETFTYRNVKARKRKSSS